SGGWWAGGNRRAKPDPARGCIAIYDRRLYRQRQSSRGWRENRQPSEYSDDNHSRERVHHWGTEEVALGDMTIGGNLNISDSNGLVFFFDSQVTGNALFQNNTTTPPHGFGIAGNTIVGNLVCNGNNRAPELVSNTVSGQSIGQ